MARANRVTRCGSSHAVRRSATVIVVFVWLTAVPALGGGSFGGAPGGVAMAFEVTSSAFTHGGVIPKKHTCDGTDVSPPLAWRAPPAGVQSFALVCDDAKAPGGTWVHWVIYNVPAAAQELPEGIAPDVRLPDGARQGRSDFRRPGYGGPCPPRGETHQYSFRLYALDSMLDLRPNATREDLLEAMEGHVLGTAELVGRYGRQ
jgi:Raf kinase inhibitor-like YbhB/YbcL family protein